MAVRSAAALCDGMMGGSDDAGGAGACRQWERLTLVLLKLLREVVARWNSQWMKGEVVKGGMHSECRSQRRWDECKYEEEEEEEADTKKPSSV